MSPMRHRTDFEVEQQVLLGGQISSKTGFQELQLYSLMDPDTAFIHWFLTHLRDFPKQGPMNVLLDLLKWIGIKEQLKMTTELTKLSMAMGDTRKQYSGRGLRDELKRVAAGTSGNSST